MLISRFEGPSVCQMDPMWTMFCTTMFIPSARKKSDLTPELRDWTRDTVLRSEEQRHQRFLTAKESVRLVVIFLLLKQVSFGCFANLILYRTHKFHFFFCFTCDTFLPDQRYAVFIAHINMQSGAKVTSHSCKRRKTVSSEFCATLYY